MGRIQGLRCQVQEHVGCWVLDRLTVCGLTFCFYFVLQDFDFDALEKSTEYDNGLTEGSTLIKYNIEYCLMRAVFT